MRNVDFNMREENEKQNIKMDLVSRTIYKLLKLPISQMGLVP